MRPHATRLVLAALLGLCLASGGDVPKPKKPDPSPVPAIPELPTDETSPFDLGPKQADDPPQASQKPDRMELDLAFPPPPPIGVVETDANRLKSVDGPPLPPDISKSLKLNALPPAAIPDDPPPHEGALINYPITIEPTDLVLVEVIEALAGRPITGERPVRPDGTVTLGWYGDVHVAGLTLTQAKAKIVLHLRKYINDDTLGIGQFEDLDGKRVIVGPEGTDRVFVDITVSKSKDYYVLGDIEEPGRFPFTGKDTVLGALTKAGGGSLKFDAKNIRLVRPSRGGKPEKVFTIDLEAIVMRGDKTRNLQLFPDDRLVIGRDSTSVPLATFRINRRPASGRGILSPHLIDLDRARRSIGINTVLGDNPPSTPRDETP